MSAAAAGVQPDAFPIPLLRPGTTHLVQPHRRHDPSAPRPGAGELGRDQPDSADDWHAHFRDGAVLADVVPASAARFARAVAMPNLSPPVTATGAALAYRDRILAAAPPGAAFEPLMTLYLTDDTGAGEVRRAAASGRCSGSSFTRPGRRRTPRTG